MISTDNPLLWEEWLADCRQLGVEQGEDAREKLAHFYWVLIEANKTTNLTRITAPEDFLYRSLLDSLVLGRWIPENARLADIGSGAGLPAIPLAIARPDITVTAVESVGKKCAFITHAAEVLNLPNLSARNERSEETGRDPELRESFDVVTARAVAAMPVLAELCLPLAKPGGLFLAMKGLSYEEEAEAAAKALKTLGGKLETVHGFDNSKLSGSKVLAIRKVAKTPPQYPRTPGTPAKKPL